MSPTLLQETQVPGGTRTRLELRVGNASVPALLLLPTARPETRASAALLLHGYSSRGEVMADSVGQALLRRGVASLAPDLPLHGTRGNPLEVQSLRNPLEVARLWRLALREGEEGVDYLRSHPALHPARVAVVGYSLGSFLAVRVVAARREVSAVVLAAGGDLPLGTPLSTVARALVDPPRAVKALAGRPLLMVNGRHDPVIRPDQAERLFAAASEPKELRWWNGGHSVPQPVIEEAAEWLAGRLGGGGEG